jgi:hypothetical protein
MRSEGYPGTGHHLAVLNAYCSTSGYVYINQYQALSMHQRYLLATCLMSACLLPAHLPTSQGKVLFSKYEEKNRRQEEIGVKVTGE